MKFQHEKKGNFWLQHQKYEEEKKKKERKISLQTLAIHNTIKMHKSKRCFSFL